MKPVCHIVAGPNGAGKSTFALNYLPEDDYDRRRRETGDWRLKNLLAQFAAEGQPLTSDVWDRLEQDRRQALEDDLAWIARGREASCLSQPSCPSRPKRSSK